MNPKSKRILLVEDDPGDALLTTEALLASCIVAATDHVGDGEAAWQYLCQRAGEGPGACPDLVILDLNLPRKDGRELLRDLKADTRLRSIPVVIFTTCTAEEEIRYAYASYANCYVCKPIQLDDYQAAVRSMAHYWFQEAELPLLPFAEGPRAGGGGGNTAGGVQ